MPLLQLWSSNSEAISQFSIDQVVATAGDGNLRDESLCAQELRTYLSEVATGKIATYVEQCLATSLPKGGAILQDLVNELGRRLDYTVTHGRYQGTANTIGFDGIWFAPEGHAIVAEVKTTDAYRISLNTLARYRFQLSETRVIKDPSSILIVVGRQDTGELEAQVRGSRHAWDVRLISVEALLKLVKLKQTAEGPETDKKIRDLLVPTEYTRLDALVDVMFTAAKDLEEAAVEVAESVAAHGPEDAGDGFEAAGAWQFTDRALLQHKRDELVHAVSRKYGASLRKEGRAIYSDKSLGVRAATTISKRYIGRAILTGMPIIHGGMSIWLLPEPDYSYLGAWTWTTGLRFLEM